MAKKNFQTGLIITGDAKGAIKATALTEDALKKLNNTNKRTARQSAGAWDKTKAAIFGVKGAVAVLAPALAALASINGLKNVIDDIDKIGKMSQRLGMTTEALSELQHVAELSGVGFNVMTMGLQRMTRRVSEAAQGTGEAVKALKELNINAQELNKLRPEQQYEAIADALFKLENQSDRVRLAMKLFDTQGVSLVQTMTNGAAGIREMREEAQSLGLSLSSEMTQAAAQANDTMARLDATFNAIGIRLTNNMIPAINDTINAFMDLFNLRPERIVALDKISTLVEQIETLEAKLKAGTAGNGRNKGTYLSRYQQLSADLMTAIEAAKIYGASQAQVDVAMGKVVDATEKASVAEKNHTGTIIKAAKATHNSISNYDRELNKLKEKNILLKGGERALYSYQLTHLKFTDAQKKTALALYDSNKALVDQAKKADLAAKAEVNAASTIAKAKSDAHKSSLQAVDDQLRSTENYLNDLGATSQDVFSGMTGDVFNLSGALTAMTKELDINARQIKLNQDNWDAYLKAPDANLGLRAEKIAKFAQNEQDLNQKTTDLSIQGYMNVGNAAIGVFSSMANAAEDGSKQQESMQKAAAALTVVMAGINGTAAVIKAFADGGWPLAIAVGGAVGGLAASIGATVSQFSGQSISSQQKTQEAQGKGSVLGDSSEVSKSLDNAFKGLEELTTTSLDYSSQMLVSLQNIDNNTKLLTNLINTDTYKNRFPNISGNHTSFLAGNPTDVVQNTINKMFSQGEGETLINNTGELIISNLASGFKNYADNTLGNILDNIVVGPQLSNINAGAFPDSNRIQAEIDMRDTVNTDLQSVFFDIIDTISTGSSMLSDEFSNLDINKLLLDSNIVIDKVDFGDMNATEFNDALNGVLSKWADQLVGLASPELFEFQQMGEGLYETLIRVSGEVDSASVALTQFNFDAIKYTDVLNKQGNVEAQIVKQTIVANEEFSAVSDIMKTVSGDAGELVDTYKQLREAQYLLIGTGLGENTLSADLIGGAGGIGSLQSALESFYGSFFSEAEQFDIQQANLKRSFGDLNLAMPKTNEEFRKLVLGIDATTAEGRVLLGQVLQLSPAMADLTSSMDSAGNAISELDSILQGVDTNFKRLGDSQLESTLHGITDSFLGTIQSAIDAGASFRDIIHITSVGLQTGAKQLKDTASTLKTTITDLGEVFRDVKNNILKDILKLKGANNNVERDFYQNLLETGSIEEQKNAASELQSIIMQNYEDQTQSAENLTSAIDNIKSHIDSLLLNDSLSALTPEQMLNEAKRQFDDTLGKAKSGNVDAINNLSGIGDEYLNKARAFYASSNQYTDIFNNVLSALNGIDAPAKLNFDKINADASVQAVTELEKINSTLGSIHEFTTSTTGQAGTQYSRSEANNVRQEFIDAVSAMSNKSTGDIERALSGDFTTDSMEITAGNVTINAAESAKTAIDAATSAAGGSTNQWIKDLLSQNLPIQQSIESLKSRNVSMPQVDKAMGWNSGSTKQFLIDSGIPLFANGGIANSPSIFGEAGLEAAVPIPNGKIPVTINQGAGLSYRELVAEVKLMNKELSALRQDQAEQNSAIIDSNYAANESNAESINSANKDNLESNQWKNNKIAVT